MADEIKINLVATVTNSNANVRYAPGAIEIDQSTKGYDWRTVSVTTGGVTITPAVASPGIVVARNLDSTNFVVLKNDTANFSKLLAGELSVFRVPATFTLKAAADTATCKVEFLILEA